MKSDPGIYEVAVSQTRILQERNPSQKNSLQLT